MIRNRVQYSADAPSMCVFVTPVLGAMYLYSDETKYKRVFMSYHGASMQHTAVHALVCACLTGSVGVGQ